MDILAALTAQFHLRPSQVENTVKLIDDGNTIPFIARYRKEVTGSLDDQVLRELAERLTYLRSLDEQREKVRAVIEEQGALTEELAAALDAAATLTEIDDLYRPYRPKRKTRASVAKARGLQPLADALYAQEKDMPDPLALAADYVGEEVPAPADALQGAMDILAERISDDASVRKRLRVVCMAGGSLVSKAAKDEDSVYSMYYDFREPLNKLAGHRILAVNRGEREEFLKVSVDFDRAKALAIVCSNHVKEGSPATETVRAAAQDAYDRLIFPSIEREIRGELTERASDAAIKVFSLNLRHLLMQPPVKGKVALGLDPGYRTGCKTAVVDGTGKVLDTGVIYPVPPHNKVEEAKRLVTGWIETYGVEIIAIGNGTASHETEVFAADLIRNPCTERWPTWWSARRERRCIPPPSWRPRNSPTTTCPCAPRCPSPGGCRIPWPSWSKSIPRPSGWASISTTCPRSSCPRPWTAWWRAASTQWGWISTPPPPRCWPGWRA